jgi:hypothetical protein
LGEVFSVAADKDGHNTHCKQEEDR